MFDLISRDKLIINMNDAKAILHMFQFPKEQIDVAEIVADAMIYNVRKAPTIDAVPVVHLADLLERWNWDCAMCTHSVDCDKCELNRCINELKEIINSGERKDGNSDGKVD